MEGVGRIVAHGGDMSDRPVQSIATCVGDSSTEDFEGRTKATNNVLEEVLEKEIS
jgi:hypothetical protein